MKNALLLLVLLLPGCYTAYQYPLQRGDKVIFNNERRANEFRRLSANDQFNTNRVVEITRPCAITTE